MASIYDHPETYDLEHSGPQPDIDFFVSLAKRLQPVSILDVACGDGRITRPLAATIASWQGCVHGIDTNEPMLTAARRKPTQGSATYEKLDVRELAASAQYDLAISACASLSHLVSQDDQLICWRNIFRSLKPGGRFVIAEVAPDYGLLAESMTSPASTLMRLDGDYRDGEARLLRYRAARYYAHEQRLDVHFLYDHFTAEGDYQRYVNDYKAHVFFPNELRLLFLATGFSIDAEWGSYDGSPLSHESRCLIFSGQRPA